MNSAGNIPLAKRIEMRFQLDGAPTHFINKVRQFVDENCW